MKKRLMFSIVSILILALLSGCGLKGAGYKVEQQAGQYSVSFTLAGKPAVGDNYATVIIKDASGAVVSNAQVQIDYTMPAMPGMPAMNYNAVAPLTGNEYTATINLPMSGSWNIVVKFAVGGQTQKINFSIDAR
ncbi:MAG TPA: hypothetical protein DF296_00560 [Candidatus Margulisbacteria bacterium]|nr:MAG: hypothetical protein A2X43_10135 [Candidatus Margulisbacteria bacterium GWD2_39_127]OGI01514.1 MAG: hypothetical protein A2X42_12035 [Candidatus Margulisbacteria bacterium GWF2_38_17]HAR64412.1 hypothetical protein [Candidatus Margulisiibacteriota bacterium]HCT83675.1 hypothetical protein [Candidatus Margulisiibacteriota bacterium]